MKNIVNYELRYDHKPTSTQNNAQLVPLVGKLTQNKKQFHYQLTNEINFKYFKFSTWKTTFPVQRQNTKPDIFHFKANVISARQELSFFTHV